jgi:hypothetical protein
MALGPEFPGEAGPADYQHGKSTGQNRGESAPSSRGRDGDWRRRCRDPSAGGGWLGLEHHRQLPYQALDRMFPVVEHVNPLPHCQLVSQRIAGDHIFNSYRHNDHVVPSSERDLLFHV